MHKKDTGLDFIFFSEYEAIDLQNSLSTIGIFAVLYRMDEVTSSNIDALSLNEPNSDPDRLNFTVLCRLSSCQSFLQKVIIFIFIAVINFFVS